MSDTRATVTAYRRRDHAGVAQHALEVAGIDSQIEETNIAKVRVDYLDALRAGDVLNQVAEPLDEIVEADEPAANTTCPSCGSADVHSSMRIQIFAAIAAVVIGVSIAVSRTEAGFFVLAAAGLFLLMGSRWRCGECGEGWS